MSQPDPAQLPPPPAPPFAPPIAAPTGPGGAWPARRRSRSGFWGGGILIIVGVYFLLFNFGLLDWLRWDVFWPVLLIGLGLYLVVRRLR